MIISTTPGVGYRLLWEYGLLIIEKVGVAATHVGGRWR